MPLYCNDGEVTNIDSARSIVLGGSRARTICPDTTVFSKEELQMRKKAEVLQYNRFLTRGTSGVVESHKHRYAQILKRDRAGRRTYASQSSKGTNPNIQGLGIVNNTIVGRPGDGKICSIKGLTTSLGYKAGIRGDNRILSFNPNMPTFAFSYNALQAVPQFDAS